MKRISGRLPMRRSFWRVMRLRHMSAMLGDGGWYACMIIHGAVTHMRYLRGGGALWVEVTP